MSRQQFTPVAPTRKLSRVVAIVGNVPSGVGGRETRLCSRSITVGKLRHVAYHPINARYYRLLAADCENAADDEATTPSERAIMLHCAARWHWLAEYHGSPPASEQEWRDKGQRSAGIEWQLVGIIKPAIRHRALKLIDELEAEARAVDNGDSEE